jgi:hypothetical protein
MKEDRITKDMTGKEEQDVTKANCTVYTTGSQVLLVHTIK